MSTAEVLRDCAADNRAAFIAYLPVGYPDVPGSLDAMRAVVAGGADIVEVGIPYSDPVMDGPTIAKATQVALANGSRVRDVFAAVDGLREGLSEAETGVRRCLGRPAGGAGTSPRVSP